MNKLFKNVTAIALAGAMVMGMNVSAFAVDTIPNTDSKLTGPGTDGTPSTSNVATDTGFIKLIKDYDRGASTQPDSNSPAEDFILTITPYGVWNAGSSTGAENGAKYAIGNIPLLGVAADDPGGAVSVDTTNRKTTVTIKANAGDAKDAAVDNLSQKLTIPTYNSVGDFWYKVEETNNQTTGVIYSTNDKETIALGTENHAHKLTYYIHVQVVNNPDYDSSVIDSKKFFRSVTLHKDAPTAPSTNAAYNTWVDTSSPDANYKPGVKVNDIQNEYYAGELSITKEVTGNAGDHDKRFKVTVVFTKPSNTIITSDITYTAANAEDATGTSNFTLYGQDDASSAWKNSSNNTINSDTSTTATLTNTVTFWIKHGETVTFKNIPYGVTYTVTETQPSDDTYKNKIEYINNTGSGTSKDDATSFDGISLAADTVSTTELNATFSKNATGAISDIADTIKITNERVMSIDIGVITDNAPYIALLVIAAAAMVIFLRRKSRMEE